MNQLEDVPAPDRRRPSVAGRGLATLAAWYAVVIATVVLLVFLQPAEKTDGTCDGIGFGCTPNPRDSLILAAVILGPPMLLAGLVISGVALALLARRMRSGIAAGTVSAFAGFAAAFAVPVVMSLL